MQYIKFKHQHNFAVNDMISSRDLILSNIQCLLSEDFDDEELEMISNLFDYPYPVDVLDLMVINSRVDEWNGMLDMLNEKIDEINKNNSLFLEWLIEYAVVDIDPDKITAGVIEIHKGYYEEGRPETEHNNISIRGNLFYDLNGEEVIDDVIDSRESGVIKFIIPNLKYNHHQELYSFVNKLINKAMEINEIVYIDDAFQS